MINLISGQLVHDGGPIYTETDMHRLIKEPYNTLTAFLFVVLAIYWMMRLRRQYRHQALLSIMIPILLTGGIGGTLFHGLRSSRWFLFMDFVPILLLLVLATVYFWQQLLSNRWLGILALFPFFLLQGLAFRYITQRQLAISLSYATMGLMLLTPLTLILFRTRFVNAGLVGYALLAFVVALLSRSIDGLHLLPMGTHFLWHIFGAAAAGLMMEYIYRFPASSIAHKAQRAFSESNNASRSGRGTIL